MVRLGVASMLERPSHRPFGLPPAAPGCAVSSPVPRSRTACTASPPMAAGDAARSRSNTAALFEGGWAMK